MSYIIFRDKIDAANAHNSYKAATYIANIAMSSEARRNNVEQLIARFYWKTMIQSAAMAAKGKGMQAVSVLPESNGFWDWNKSFETALDVASQHIGGDIYIVIDPSNDFVTIGTGKDSEEASDIASILARDKRPFCEFLQEKMKEKQFDVEVLAKKSNLRKSTISSLCSGEIFVPSKSQLLAIGIALELDEDHMNDMMQNCGYSLSDNVDRDAIILYYIRKGIYDMTRINKTLFLSDLPTVGAHKQMKR